MPALAASAAELFTPAFATVGTTVVCTITNVGSSTETVTVALLEQGGFPVRNVSASLRGYTRATSRENIPGATASFMLRLAISLKSEIMREVISCANAST